MSHAAYLDTIFDSPKLFSEKMDDLCNFIQKEFPKIDAIAVRGNSGVLIAGVISYKLKLPIILVRKEEEATHSWCKVEFSNEICAGGKLAKYLIIDDLVASGETVRIIIREIEDFIFKRNERIDNNSWYEDDKYSGANEKFLIPECIAVVVYDGSSKEIFCEGKKISVFGMEEF